MTAPRNLPRCCVFLAITFICVSAGKPARAQVSELVVVGVTPTCPYGIAACASGAREGLKRLENVRLVAQNPDRYNCTFDMQIDRRALPDLDKWRSQLASVVGETFIFRGVEVAVIGTIVDAQNVLTLHVAGCEQVIELAPLENKLQWNFRKGSAREPEPAEQDAWRQLATLLRTSSSPSLKVEVVGPLRYRGKTPVVEVREFYESKDP
jgi:hypothetical protein